MTDIKYRGYTKVSASKVSQASNATNAWDVCLSLDVGGKTITGGVTLSPNAASGEPEPSGDSIDQWMSQDLIAMIDSLPEEDQKDAQNEIMDAASEAIENSDVDKSSSEM